MTAFRLLWRELISGHLTLLALALTVAVGAMTTTAVPSNSHRLWVLRRVLS
jgi:hypothetical protein